MCDGVFMCLLLDVCVVPNWKHDLNLLSCWEVGESNQRVDTGGDSAR